jgi:hypothetical protein
MGYATVRQSVADWIAPPNVPGITKVYQAQPPFISGEDYGLFTVPTYSLGEQTAGCFAFVHVNDSVERRIAVGGATDGRKEITYQVGIVLPFIALKPTDDSYIGAWDAIADNLKARIRANRTLGQDGLTIFQAGEGEADLHIASDLPRIDRGTGNVHIWSVMELDVIEIIES